MCSKKLLVGLLLFLLGVSLCVRSSYGDVVLTDQEYQQLMKELRQVNEQLTISEEELRIVKKQLTALKNLFAVLEKSYNVQRKEEILEKINVGLFCFSIGSLAGLTINIVR